MGRAPLGKMIAAFVCLVLTGSLKDLFIIHPSIVSL